VAEPAPSPASRTPTTTVCADQRGSSACWPHRRQAGLLQQRCAPIIGGVRLAGPIAGEPDSYSNSVRRSLWEFGLRAPSPASRTPTSAVCADHWGSPACGPHRRQAGLLQQQCAPIILGVRLAGPVAGKPDSYSNEVRRSLGESGLRAPSPASRTPTATVCADHCGSSACWPHRRQAGVLHQRCAPIIVGVRLAGPIAGKPEPSATRCADHWGSPACGPHRRRAGPLQQQCAPIIVGVRLAGDGASKSGNKIKPKATPHPAASNHHSLLAPVA
jgi:hypothetical protein